MLRLAEELILLLLDKQSGALAPVPDRSMRCALAAAVLMDLALEDRIDTDFEHLFPVDSTPVGDDLLDPCLALVANDDETRDTAWWIALMAEPRQADALRSRAVDRLVERGIVERETGGLLALARGVARSRRYPMVDGEAGQEVELRIMTALFTDEVPSPRDIMLISLVHACGIFDRLLTPGELAQVRGRIDLICKLELIGRSIFEAIRKAGVSDAKTAKGWPPPGRVERARALAGLPCAGGGLPIVGNAFSMMRDPIEYLARQYRNLGPVFRVRAFSRTYAVLAGPEANMFIQRHGRTHLRSVDAYAGLARGLDAHRMLIGMDGAEHFRLRKAMARGYSRGYFHARLHAAIDIAAKAIDAVPERRPIAALPFVRSIVTRQIAELCTGVWADEYLDDLIAYLDRVIAITTMRRPAFMMRTPGMCRARARMEALCEQVLEAHGPDRRAGKELDFIDQLLALHRADPQFLPEKELFVVCIGPFVAGLHTEASVATFMLYALLKHPELMKAVRLEVNEFFANSGPTAKRLRAMEITHRVGLETLRIFPIAPAQMRTVVNTFEFAGHVIPAGTSVMFATTVPHKLPEYYPEPERFDIDRYLPERAEHTVPGVYASFGMGTHRCLGSGFAEAQLAVTIATLLHKADITMHPPNYDMKVDTSKIPAPSARFRIKVARRRCLDGTNC